MTTTKTTTGKSKLYLLVREERTHDAYSGEYFHIRANIVTQRAEARETGTFQLPYGTDDEYGDGLLLTNLVASCQGDKQSRLREEVSPVYGYDTEYRDVFSVDERKAKRMHRTLKTINAGLERLREKRGYTHTYGEYLGRLAEVLRCTGFVIEAERGTRNVTGERWTWLSVGEGVNRVNHLIEKWRQEAKPQQLAGGVQ